MRGHQRGYVAPRVQFIGEDLANVAEDAIGDNGIVLEGDAPKVRSATRISFARRSFLKLKVPSTGYDPQNVPITAETVSFDDTSSIYVEGIDAMTLEKGVGSGHLIASATDEISIPSEVLAAANASLSECAGAVARLALDDDGRNLRLYVRRKTGMAVSVR